MGLAADSLGVGATRASHLGIRGPLVPYSRDGWVPQKQLLYPVNLRQLNLKGEELVLPLQRRVQCPGSVSTA